MVISLHTQFENSFTNIPCTTSREGIDYRLSLVPLEINLKNTINILSRTHPSGNTVMGSGYSLFPLDAASVIGLDRAKSSHSITKIVLFHRTDRIAHFYTRLKPIVIESEDRLEAARKIEELVRRHKDIYFPEKCPCNRSTCSGDLTETIIERFKLSISENISWLSSPSRYDKIRSIITSGQLAVIQTDFTDKTHTLSFIDTLEKTNSTISSMYIGSDRDIIENEGELELFRDNITSIVSPDTLIISTKRRCIYRFQTFPKQIYMRKEYPLQGIIKKPEELFPDSISEAETLKEYLDSIKDTPIEKLINTDQVTLHELIKLLKFIKKNPYPKPKPDIRKPSSLTFKAFDLDSVFQTKQQKI
jgi:hypothetical protein